MSTVISRLYNWVTDKANSVKITASRQDGELDQFVVALNRKVLCSGSAPNSPIAGQTWVDTTNKFLKIYRNNEWVVQGVVHVGTAAPTTPQEGDVWWDSTNNILYVYDGATQRSIPIGQPTNYRDGLLCVQASTATITVGPGTIEVNGSILAKTAATTLTLSTAADYAGGVSLRAVSTYGYIGIDSSGNIKMHTTAPTHDNFAVSTTAGKKRYATWSSTVYRIIGWFYMNATGSGELNSFEVSNLAEHGVPNIVYRAGSTDDTINDTSYGTDMTETSIHFYTSGGPVEISFSVGNASVNSDTLDWSVILDDGSNITTSERTSRIETANDPAFLHTFYATTYVQGVKTISALSKVSTSDVRASEKMLRIREN